MNILITGGAGYIGSLMVPKLLREGYHVTVIDNLLFNQHSLLDCCFENRFSFIKGDICDFSLIKQLMPNFDVIIPLAAIVGAPACDKNPDLTRKVNYYAQLNILNNISKDQK